MTRFLFPALVAISAMPALAQDGATGLSHSGEVKLEYVDANSNMLAFRGDAAMSWRSGGLLGFDASVDTIHTDEGDDFTNFWAAAVFTMGSSEVAIGAPRPLLDSLRVNPRFSTSRLIDLETSFLRGPLTTIASAQDNGMTPGLTYKYNSGDLTFGAGYHHLNDGSGVNLFEGIMRYDGAGTSYFISAEYADTSSSNVTFLQIGALHDSDRFDAGVTLGKVRSSGAIHTLRLYGAFDVMQSLTLRGDVLMVEKAEDIYSLSATYTMDSGLFVEGGGTVLNGSDEIYDIGVGFKF